MKHITIEEKANFILNTIEMYENKGVSKETTDRVLKFLANKQNDKIINRILDGHSPLFSLLIARLAKAYQYWYIKKNMIIMGDDIYFKFSNVLMYDDKFIPKKADKEKTREIIRFFMKKKYIKRNHFDIDDGLKATFYSVNFKKFLLYMIVFYEKLKVNPKNDVEKIKKELFNENIIEKYWDAFNGEETEHDPSLVSYISS